MKAKREYKVLPRLPEQLEALRTLAYNVVWSWHPDIRDLFQRIDAGLWSNSGHNPVQMLGLVSQQRLQELAQEPGFVSQLNEVARLTEKYISSPRLSSQDYSGEENFLVAYLSAEFGITSCLPIYSGGLGILAGDHVKSASDLNLPLMGIGLLYQEGYFSQYLSSDGWQMETYPVNDFDNMPLHRVRGEDGNPLKIQVEFKDQPVIAQVWKVQVGRVPLYLLDTNLLENPEEIRDTTAQLYGGDREMRLRQEILLGIGGMRALAAMGLEPTVVHMNEGHASFSALERIKQLRENKGLTFDQAREVVQASTVFTTHTPVPAGNDTFDPGLIMDYFSGYARELGINIKVLMGYGRVNPRDENELFGVTPLALRLSAHANGVSRLHGHVSRNMWQDVWPHNPVEDVPIDYITNGIHAPTWISREFGQLYNRYLGPDWAEDPDNQRVWEQVDNIPTTELWRTHVRCREQLVGFTRQRLGRQMKQRGASNQEMRSALEVLNPDALTIGFARRFATYKRATLVFSDPDRLDRIINHPDRPIQFILAGKAHPQDNAGKEFIKHIIHLARQERFRRKIVFLEDYNIHIARLLLAGCDIWLNTPRRPLEACGTSGMKAVVNGALNLSILDGWWDEGFESRVGWAIGKGEEWDDHQYQDEVERRDLYNLLEKNVAPLFYARGDDNIPRGWVDKMRAGLRKLAPVFNSHRMVQDYTTRYYVPCSQRFAKLSRDGMAGAKEMAQWRSKIMTGWGDVAVLDVTSTEGQEALVGDELEVKAVVKLGGLSPEDVTVEAYFGGLDPNGDFMERETSVLNPNGVSGEGQEFKGTVPCNSTGRFGFTVRVTPSQQHLENPFAMGLVKWA